ncbi:MAG: TolC family protein, partial [Prolixibacteraceae bacterium]|nr:TolC family protein [Prolixibacteraceae bacterium]
MMKKISFKKLVNIHILMMWVFSLALLSLSLSGNAQTWSLQKCIDTAQVYNKNLQMGRNNMELSAERAQEAKANLLPKINLSADYKYFTELPYQLMP